MFDSVKKLVDYRYMIRNLVKRDIRGRYKGSILGFLWNFILPLIQIIVFIVVFGTIFKNQIPNYPIFLISGMVMWIWFSETLTESSGTLVGNSELLKKIYFPREILPIVAVTSKMINFLIMILITFIVLIAYQHEITINMLYLPLVITITYVMLLGVSLLLSALDVFFRDVQYIVSALLMAWIWATPIMYMEKTLDNELLNLVIKYNPLTYFVRMYQDIIYYGAPPGMFNVCICTIMAIVALIIGLIVFRKTESHFAEVL